MILINCTSLSNKNIINENYLNIRTISVEFSNKMLMDATLLRTLTDFTEPLLHQVNSVLFILNALDEALVNMKNDENGKIRYKMFLSLLRALISAGHEVFIFDNNGVNMEMVEIAKMDGVSVFTNDIALLRAIKNSSEGLSDDKVVKNAEEEEIKEIQDIENNNDN